MIRKEVEKNIPKAIEVIDKVMRKENENVTKLPKEFKGYISNFGASIIQSGLLPTIAFFEDSESNSQGERHKISEIIYGILLYGKDEKYNQYGLFNYVIDKKNQENEIKEEIIHIVISLKLAIRTFDFKDM